MLWGCARNLAKKRKSAWKAICPEAVKQREEEDRRSERGF